MAYIIMTRTEKMPANCWGTYRKIAVVELEEGFDGEPAMISERSRGVKRIVEEWRKLNVGCTPRSAYKRALAEAEALKQELES